MGRYFKLVALDDDVKWLRREFRAGRVRFGWSGPGMDLRILQQKDRNEEEAVTWRYTKFLLERIEPGDRVVVQFEQPLREFWIGEVTDGGYEFDKANRGDFNHILHVEPLTPKAISATSTLVPGHLRHDLTKRGQYYEIYPEESVAVLDRIVEGRLWEGAGSRKERTGDQEFLEAHEDLVQRTIETISRRWPSKDFERFCERLLGKLDFVEVKDPRDTRKGWDLLIQIRDPITGKVLLEDVPVQCKNYQGEVDDDRPLQDLERCILDEGSSRRVAYLFILGDLTDEYRHRIERLQETLTKKVGESVELVVVDQEIIAELYLRAFGPGGDTDRSD